MGGFPNPLPQPAGTATIVAGNVTPADNATPTDNLDSNADCFVFDGTNWDRMRAGSPTANPGSVGVLAAMQHITDGGAINRVIAIGGTADGGGGGAIPPNGPVGFNGGAYDRLRTASGVTNNAATSLGTQLVAPIGTWTLTSAPAANTQATASKAAGASTIRHVCTGISATVVATGASVAGPVTIVLRDGATGAGTILATWLLNIPAGVGVPNVPLVIQGLNISGSANTAMTIESTAAGGANTQLAVNATGYSTP